MLGIARNSTSSQSRLVVHPLRLIHSLGYFFIPGLMMFLSVHYLMPTLHASGLSALNSYLIAYAIPLTFLLLAALIIYTTTDNPLIWQSFRARYRLEALTRTDCLWIALALIAEAVLTLTFSRIDQRLIHVGVIPYLPVADLSQQANTELVTGWFALLPAMGLLTVSVLAEELWFRGYVLPRQIAAHGDNAWIQNWLLWWFFMHIFKWWGLFTILPATAVTVYLAHRRQNTTASIVMHYIANAFSLIPTILIVMNLI